MSGERGAARWKLAAWVEHCRQDFHGSNLFWGPVGDLVGQEVHRPVLAMWRVGPPIFREIDMRVWEWGW